ncbi:hypothetical protein PM082_021740 [Marasmius tenuissimus]|nr:hypothetical protein PM082_021740 [Marasmius tenuissimus]
MSTEFFRKAQHLKINSGSGSFSHVEGNQVNYSTTIVHREEREGTIFDEVRNVKRGDICKIRDIHVEKYRDLYRNYWRSYWRGRRRNVDKTVSLAELDGTYGRLFTVVSYAGPEAREEFEENFRWFLSAVSSNTLQVYAIDKGSVPSLIFWNELVPTGHFERRLGLWSRLYLYSLSVQLGCERQELWIDNARGLVCRGPCAGPDIPFPSLTFGGSDGHLGALIINNLPAAVETIQEDIFLRFLASCKSKEIDRFFLHAIKIVFGSGFSVDFTKVRQPTLLSSSTDAPIAIADSAWEAGGCLSERRLLKNGLTRFTLAPRQFESDFSLNWNQLAGDVQWLLQAWSFFYASGITLEDDLSVYRVRWPSAELHGSLSRSRLRYEQQCQHPIYLFIHSSPPNWPPNQLNANYNVSDLHYWSFQEDGQSSLPPGDLGLPINLKSIYHLQSSLSRQNNVYKLIHDYQRIRGFDPTTTAFARHHGYPIFHAVSNSDRLHEVSFEAPFYKQPSPPPYTRDFPARLVLPTVGAVRSRALPTLPSVRR